MIKVCHFIYLIKASPIRLKKINNRIPKAQAKYYIINLMILVISRKAVYL